MTKSAKAGGVLAGGHSINDTDVKYGLSVTGVIHPQRILTNLWLSRSRDLALM